MLGPFHHGSFGRPGEDQRILAHASLPQETVSIPALSAIKRANSTTGPNVQVMSKLLHRTAWSLPVKLKQKQQAIA